MVLSHAGVFLWQHCSSVSFFHISRYNLYWIIKKMSKHIILCIQKGRGEGERQNQYQKWLRNMWMFLIANHRNVCNFTSIVLPFPFNEYHRSNVHSAEFSKYNLDPDFLNLALVTVSLNVYKNKRLLKNHTDWISLLALNNFVSL